MLTVNLAGAMQRAEHAAVRAEHLEARDGSVWLKQPRSKCECNGIALMVPLPQSTTVLSEFCAVRRWQDAARIIKGAAFRRIWTLPCAAQSV